jgi:hypothetical protein
MQYSQLCEIVKMTQNQLYVQVIALLFADSIQQLVSHEDEE